MSLRTQPGPSPARWVGRTVLGVVLVAALVVGGTAVRVWYVGREDDRTHADAIVVLGAAQYNGRPSKIFEARLLHAKRLYEDGVASHIVTSGGRKEGDAYTEAEAGAKWLVEHGVPRSATVAVREGSDTLRTMRAVSAEAENRGWETAVLVSDPWHSLRTRIMARDLGVEAWVSPTHTGPIVQTRETQLRYIGRETAALLYYRVSKEPAEFGGSSLG